MRFVAFSDYIALYIEVSVEECIYILSEIKVAHNVNVNVCRECLTGIVAFKRHIAAYYDLSVLGGCTKIKV